MLIVAATFGVVAGMALRGRDAGTVAVTIAARDGGDVVLGNEAVVVAVPPRALSQDTTITVSQGPDMGPPPAEGQSAMTQFRAAPAGPAFHVDLGDAELTAPLALHVRVEKDLTSGVDDADAVLALGFYDPDEQRWVPVVGTFDDGRLSAEVGHLSWWRPWVLRVPTTGAALREAISELLPGSDSDATDAGPSDPETQAAAAAIDDYRWLRATHDETEARTARDARAVTEGGPGLVAVGEERDDNAAVWTSSDGTAWSRVPHQESLSGGSMHAVAAGGPRLVAVGWDWSGPTHVAAVWTSRDGVTWARVPHDDVVFGVPGEEQSQINAVTAGGPGFVAVGSMVPTGHSEEWAAAVWTSPDGVTWSRVAHDDSVYGDPAGMNGVVAGGPGLVAVGGSSVWTSPDGLAWSRAFQIESGHMWAVTAGGPGLVAVGSDGDDAAVWTSADGASWTRVPHDDSVFGGSQSQSMHSVAAGASGLVAVGDDYAILSDPENRPNLAAPVAAAWTSPDGVTWSRVPHDDAVFGDPTDEPEDSQLMRSVVPTGPRFAAVGHESRASRAAMWMAEPVEEPLSDDGEVLEFSAEESRFRRLIEDTLEDYPTHERLNIRHANLTKNLQEILTSLCIKSVAQSQNVVVGLDVAMCAGQNVVTQGMIKWVLDRALETTVGTGLAAFHPYSLGGKLLLGAVQLAVVQALSEDPPGAMVRALTVELVAAQFPHAVGRYLSMTAAVADQSIVNLIEDLAGDEIVTRSVTGRVERGQTIPADGVEAGVSYIYSPDTHRLVSYVTVDSEPDRIYVVSYRVEKTFRGSARLADDTAVQCFYIAADGGAHDCLL